MTSTIRFSFVGLAALALAACATVYRPVSLPVVPHPVLEPVTQAELQCLTPDAYRRIVDRERALKTWGLAESAIIDANNKAAK